MKKIFWLTCACIVSGVSFAQIKPNEKLVFAASYEVSGLMTNIAQVTMQTETLNTAKSSYLHLSLVAETFTKWDTFFKIRDSYDAYVNPTTLKPSMYKRNVFEGKYTKTEKYIFNADGVTVNTTSKRMNKPEIKNTVKIGSSTLDIVTLVYKLRTYDFSKLKPGQIASFVVIFDEKQYPISIKMLGKGMISAGNLGKKECYKLSVMAKTNKLKGADKNLIWITTDSKRIPCLINFSIPVGVGQLTLSRATGI